MTVGHEHHDAVAEPLARSLIGLDEQVARRTAAGAVVRCVLCTRTTTVR